MKHPLPGRPPARSRILALGLLCLAAAIFPARAASASGVNWIRSAADIPAFDVPPFHGQRYESMVPDTLDIQERAALSVNALTRLTDPALDYVMYFSVNFSANPPQAYHDNSDYCLWKFMESLPLMRLISGSEQNLNVDRVWMTDALRTLGPDGLMYWPSFPWAKGPGWYENGPGPEGDQYAIPQMNGRAIGAMTLYMLRDPRGPWRAAIDHLIQGLNGLAIRQGDFAYFPQGGFTPGGARPRRAEMPIGIFSSLAGWTDQGLAQYTRQTDDPAAAKLARELARYIRFHGEWYGPEGEFLPNYPWKSQLATVHQPGVHPFVSPVTREDHHYIHFQHHMIPLLGMLDTALVTHDPELAEFVRKSYEWARTQGETTVGYFPENIMTAVPYGTQEDYNMTAETCQLAGMIGVALKLSAAGIGDYWDDADRWIRNQFAEDQLRRSDWIYRFSQAAGGVEQPFRQVPLSKVRPNGQGTVDHVPERSVGAFAGWPSANDFYTGQGRGIMNCCTGNGTRALYYVWENMIGFKDGELSVNLLLNRPSRWADVLSYIPYEGKVEVRIKEACRLRIRIPQWTKPGEVTCTVDGRPHALGWDGRYALIGQVTPAQSVLLAFPIRERSVEVNIEKRLYTLTLKGNDVVAIDPPGRYCPLYQRDYYRENTVRWKKVTRFVSDETIEW